MRYVVKLFGRYSSFPEMSREIYRRSVRGAFFQEFQELRLLARKLPNTFLLGSFFGFSVPSRIHFSLLLK